MACRHRAFTLVELLVVVAIIAVVAGILTPVFLRVREQARRATCRGNLRQIGMALIAYSSDHDELMPIEQLGSGASTHYGPGVAIWYVREGRPIFLGVLHPYVRSIDLFYCPGMCQHGREAYSYAKQAWGTYDPTTTLSKTTVHSAYLWRGAFAGASWVLSENSERALVLDDNVLARYVVSSHRHNHGYHEDTVAGDGIYSADFVNVLYGDGHVKGFSTPHNELSGPLFQNNEPFYGPPGTYGPEGMFGRIFLAADRMGGGGE